MKVWELKEGRVYHNGKNPKTIRVLDKIDGVSRAVIFRTIQGKPSRAMFQTTNGPTEIISLEAFAKWAVGEETQ